jgi:hypothetical protein
MIGLIAPRFAAALRFCTLLLLAAPAAGIAQGVVAPYIATQPASVVLPTGGTLLLYSGAAASGTITYQWYKDGNAIPSATGGNYYVSPVVASDSGSYTAVVSNAGGSVTTNPAIVTVQAAVGPAIVTQPSNVTVALGATVGFGVTVTGSNPLTYQWFKDGSPLPDATSSYYSFSPASTASAGSYQVTVTNAWGAVTSSPATATISAGVAPIITSQPQSQTIGYFSSAGVNAIAAGSPPLSYQWYKDGVAIADATSSGYNINFAIPSYAGNYSVVVSNAFGSATSTAATITVAAVVPPQITGQPQGVAIGPGLEASFSVSASGSANLAYQWYQDGQAIVGATGAYYYVYPTAPANAGTYTVTVTNSGGSVTSQDAVLSVLPASAPVITTQPASQTIAGTNSFQSLSVNVSGTNPLSYQWYKDGTAISGATGAGYAVPGTAVSQSGSYTVMVSNSAGSVTSAAAAVTVPAPLPPVITTGPQGGLVTPTYEFSLTVQSQSVLPATFQWYKNGVAIAGANSDYLYLLSNSATPGSYSVTVTNSLGSATSVAVPVDIEPTTVTTPLFVTEPFSTLSLAYGSSGTSLSVSAAGTAPISYQWYKDSTPISGATNNYYTFPTAVSAVTGTYTVTATNASGSATSTPANVTVLSPLAPVLLVQPAGEQVAYGSFAGFSVSASGTQPLTYQWYQDGVAIQNATNGDYSISAASAAAAGNYSVTVTNAFGSTTSTPVALAVSNPVAPLITSQPLSQTVGYGGSETMSVSATGSPPLVYQWFEDGAAIPDATSSSYYISSAIPTYAGSYTVTVTNGQGTVTSAAAALTVTAAVAPAILSQPISQILGFGGNGSVSANVSGSPNLSYQWFFNGTAIPGANSSSYYFNAVQPSAAGNYTLTVTNSAGAATTAAASIAVAAAIAPGISVQPASQVAAYGVGTSISVGVTGSPNFTYQWYLNGVAIAGATNYQYSIPSPVLSDAGTYSVTITNSAGSVTSSAATLVVSAPIAPTITQQPSDLILTTNSSAQLSVGVSGSPSFSYQWYENGTAITGQTGSSYYFYGSTAGATGLYSVKVSNSVGSVMSSTVNVTVAVPPTIATPPGAQSVAAGQTAVIGVGVVSTIPVTYQWMFNGTPLTDGGGISGSTSAALTVSGTSQLSGNYSVVISNSLGTATSSAGTLTVTAAGTGPQIALQPNPASVAVGQTVAFYVGATGTGSTTYQWRQNGLPISGANDPYLVVPNVQAATAGIYNCSITDSTGTASTNAAAITIVNSGDIGRLLNLSVRGNCGSSSGNLIAGFIVNGSSSKTVLVRAIGPTLAAFGVPGVLADPTLALHGTVSGQDSILAGNDNWGDDPNLALLFAQTGAFSLPAASLDAALSMNLAPGNYSAVVSGNNGGTGIALAEVYDATSAFTSSTPRLINVSARCQVDGSGAGNLVAGFVVGGSTAETVLIRGTGPALAAFDVPGTLSDPVISVYGTQNGESVVIAANDNWGGDPVLSGIFAQVQAFAINNPASNDSALLITLPPGIYSANLSSQDGTAGVALIEIYEVP